METRLTDWLTDERTERDGQKVHKENRKMNELAERRLHGLTDRHRERRLQRVTDGQAEGWTV